MKKRLATFLSLIFMFSLVIVGIVLLSVYANNYFLLLLLIFVIIDIAAAFFVGMEKDRRLDVKVRWVFFILLVPVIGLFSYIYFGRKYKYNEKNRYAYDNFSENYYDNESNKEKINEVYKTDIREFKRTFNIGLREQGDIPYIESEADLQFNPLTAIPNILRDLDGAQDYILINYYIIDESEFYWNLISLLEKKVKQGVEVYLIFDFIGSYGKFTYKEQMRLEKLGFNLVAYAKLKLPYIGWQANYRCHRKDISIDGKIGYFGGSNISDEYTSKTKKFGYWHDEQVRITGPAVQGIEKIFASDWKFCTKQTLQKSLKNIGKLNNSLVKNLRHERSLVQVVACGPNHSSSAHLDILISLVGLAQKRVWLSTPYFVPPTELITQIATASRSGVDVRLVLPGISDKFLLLDFSKKHTDLLFDSGVKIYSLSKTFNHTKAYLIDDHISFIGTTNLDYRALFSDQQTMGLIYSREFNQQLEERFKWDFDVAYKYTKKPSLEHNFFIRGLILLVNWAAPLL